jgi:hypothetical protein
MRRITATIALLTVSCGGGCSSSSTATPTTPSASSTINLAGSWGLATHASSSCASILPVDSRNRSYANVTVTQAAGQATFTVLTALGTLPVLVAFISGNQVTGPFLLVDGIPGSTLHAEGQFTGTASATSINGTLNGFFTNNSAPGICAAADHQLIFTRR